MKIKNLGYYILKINAKLIKKDENIQITATIDEIKESYKTILLQLCYNKKNVKFANHTLQIHLFFTDFHTNQ